MAEIATDSFNATIRRQVFIERLKAGQVRSIVPFLREIDEGLRARLAMGDALTEFSRARVEALIAEVENLIGGVLERYARKLKADLLEFATTEAKFEARSLTVAISNPDFEATIPAPSQITASIIAAPLAVRGPSGGKLLETFLADYTSAQKAAVGGAIRQGFFEGRTNQEIVQTIRGTKAAKYRDGILAISKRQADAVVRTSVQHVSSIARLETFRANDDVIVAYEWVSTLDARTSAICQSLSGQRFKVGEGPMPPAHINCRSTTVPVLDERFSFLQEGATRASTFGPVDQDETYFSWLQKQNAKFQDFAIGPTRGKLLRDGGLSADRFARLGLSKNFEPLTLAEMQRLEPLAFQRAGIKITDSGRPIIK